MPRVLLQPVGADATARRNYQRSVREGVPLATILPYVSAADAEVLRGFAEPLRFWGSTPSEQRAKVRALAERRVGDVVAFYESRTFVARARIAHLLDNPALARVLWPAGDDEPTWQHMMLLDGVEHVSRASASVLDPVGRPDVVRGVELLSDVDSATFLDAWEGRPESPEEALEILRGLVGRPILTVTGRRNVVLRVSGDSAVVATDRSPEGEPVPALDVQRGLDLLRRQGSVRVRVDALGHRSAFVGAVLAALPDTRVELRPARVLLALDADGTEPDVPYDDLDRRAEVKVRLEQHRLRRILLDGRTRGTCALCGKDFPAWLLVAAHIKRRAACTPRERNDVRNVAMLACDFGCDALFENGYVSVDSTGTIVVSPSANSLGPPVDSYAARLNGRHCPAHTPRSAQYFAWHLLTLRP